MRLLVVAPDPIAAYRSKGLDAERINRYFNPRGMFTEVRWLDTFGECELAWPGVEHRLLTVEPDAAFDAWWRQAGSTIAHEAPTSEMLLAGFEDLPQSWWRAIGEFAPECVRGYNGGNAGFLAAHIAKRLGVPSLVSVHDVRGVAPITMADASAVMAVGEAVAQNCIARGANPAKVVTVFNRVNRELFSPEGPLPDNPPEGKPKLLCVARDTEQKNVDRLLAACEKLTQRHPQLRLVHAGVSSRDWRRFPFVTHFDRIPNTEMPRWLRWCDAFVMPSLWEGSSIALIEAFAAGAVVITGNHPTMAEVVNDGRSGFTCDPLNVDSIADAIDRGINGPQAVRSAARASSEPFDIARVEEREAALYRTLVKPRAPKVSVVLPTYNRERLIEGAVSNVLAQDYPTLELIVVNDGSTDGTKTLLDALIQTLNDARLRVLHVEHGGLPRALNAGFEQAQGEYLTWTSDDNAFRPGAIAAMVRELELDREAIMVFANYQWIDEHGRPGAVVKTGPVEDLVRANVIGLCFLYRREAAEKVGPYNPERELAEDYDYWARMARVGKLSHLNRLLYDVGDQPDSLTRRRGHEVGAVAAQVIASQSHHPQHREMLRQHLIGLAGDLKTRGLPWRSMKVAARLIVDYPLAASGWWAAARALTPRPLLSLVRRLRGAA